MKPLKEIFQTTADYFLIENSLLLIHNRNKHIVLPRQIAVYIANELYKHTQGNIAIFCNHDRTTMVHSCSQIKNFLEINDYLVVSALKKISEELGYSKPADTVASEISILQRKYDKLKREHIRLKSKLLELI